MVKINKKDSLFVTGVVIANGIADSDGDVLTKNDIKKLNSSFLEHNTDTNHDFLANYGVKIIENYVSEIDMEIKGQKVPAGSWIAKLMIWDNDIKRDIRQGRLDGLSLASQPDSNISDVSNVLNKRNTYSQFKDMDMLTPSFISIVKNPANGFKLDYYSYQTYITKNKDKGENLMTDDNGMSAITNRLLDVILKQSEDSKTVAEEQVTKSAPPQGGVAPQQQQGNQFGNVVSLETINQKLDQVLAYIQSAPQPMKSKDEKEVETVEKEVKDDVQPSTEIEGEVPKNNKEKKVLKEDKIKDEDDEDTPIVEKTTVNVKDDVQPSTEIEGEVPKQPKEKRVLKSEAPKTSHVENVQEINTTSTYTVPQGTPRDIYGRPIRE